MRLSWFYYFGRLLTRCSLAVLTRCEVEGTANIPPSGPLIVVANHLSLADPPILGAIIRRKMLFMAKSELFRRWPSRYFVRAFGAFPVQRGAADRRALEQARGLLEKGMAVAMFPEGKRSKAAQLQPAFPGSALIALHNHVPILPVGITGTETLKGFWFFQRPRLKLNIGAPFILPSLESPGREALAQATGKMMRNLAALLPPGYRGAYMEKDDAAH